MATWHTGQAFGGIGFGGWFTPVIWYRGRHRFHYGYLRRARAIGRFTRSRVRCKNNRGAEDGTRSER